MAELMKFCHSIKHDIPCPLPCAACEDECDPADVQEHEYNEGDYD